MRALAVLVGIVATGVYVERDSSEKGQLQVQVKA